MKRILFPILVLLFFCSSAMATTYYVSPSGNDSNTGLSDAQAWISITKVNGFSFSAGDDVYFKCGGVWSGVQLNIDWSGVNAGNLSVIGAYYMSGGSPVVGISGNRPIFDGAPTGTGNSKFGTVPAHGSSAGLIQSSNRNYLKIQDLQVQWSGDRSIVFNTVDYSTVTNCVVFSAYTDGIKILSGSDYNTISYNTIYDTSRISLLVYALGCGIGVIGHNTNVAYASTHNTVSHNYLHDNYGEGIDILKNVYDNIIEYNTVVNSLSAYIYFDRAAKRNIARYNLLYKTTPTGWTASGISVNDEDDPAGTEGTKIYGNLIANLRQGISMSAALPASLIKDTDIYNNTLVDCGCGTTYAPYAILAWEETAGQFQNSNIKNNIIWTTGEREDCTPAYIPTNHTGLVLDKNLWSSAPMVTAKGTNDPAYAAPLLTKTTGWNSVLLGSLTGYEFALQAGSPAIGVGANLDELYDETLNSQTVNFTTKTFALVDQDTQGAAWEIGAMAYLVSATPEVPDGTIDLPATAQTIQVGESVTFNGSGTNTPTSWLWTFGSGSGIADSTSEDPGSKQFDNVGVFTVSLTATNATGSDATPATRVITVLTAGTLIDRTDWTCTADSEETERDDTACGNAIDDSTATIWHTLWMDSPQPHWIRLDLGESNSIGGLRYLPRQDGGVNGRIAQFEIHVSADDINWGTAVATGTWPNTADEKIVTFAATGRYVRLTSLTEVNGGIWTSAGEINLTVGEVGGGDTVDPDCSFVQDPVVPTAGVAPFTVIRCSEPVTMTFTGDCTAPNSSIQAGDTTFRIDSVLHGMLVPGRYDTCYVNICDLADPPNCMAPLAFPTFTVFPQLEFGVTIQ